MSKATVLTSVGYYSAGMADTANTDPDIYDDVVRNLGDYPYLTNTTSISLAALGFNGVSVPNSVIAIYGASYANQWLGELTLREVEYLNANWRQTPGKPRAYVTTDETRDLYLYPVPTENAAPGNLIIYHTEYRANVPSYLEPAVTMLVLAEEMSRPSDHQDYDLAAVATEIGQMLLQVYA